jgi:LAO/AO transport system kinase
VDTLLEKIKEHRSYLEKTGILQQKLVQRTKNEILSLINERIVLKTNEFVDSKFGNELVDSVIDGNLDVFAASEIVLGEINKVI